MLDLILTWHPLFCTPEEIARYAIESDVHAVGVSSQAGAHKNLVPELLEALEMRGKKSRYYRSA